MRRSRSLVLLGALACARTSAPPAAPAPAWVEPSTAYVGRAIPVLLHGERFDPEVVQQLSSGSHLALDARFRAFFDGFELSDVRFVDSRTLSATIPAALPPGDYALTVEGPYGRGTAAGVFHGVVGTPAALTATASAPARALTGREVTVPVAVTNTGETPALGVAAGTATASGPAATLLPPAESADIAEGDTHVFTWRVTAGAPGTLDLTLPFAGKDAVDGSSVPAQASASIQIVTPAHLVVVPRPAPPSQPAGAPYQISAEVENDGGSDALAVQFDILSGTSGIVEVVSEPAPQDIPAGAVRTFTWTVRGTAEGTTMLWCAGAGTDATDGSTVTADPAQWTVIIFNAVALLYPTLTVPPGALPNEGFAVALRLDNPGIVDALAVQPSISVSGTGGVILLSAPTGADVPAGGSVTFVWTYTASSSGQVRFDLLAAGTDARSTNPVTASASGVTTIATATPVAANPFADGTSFAYVFAYANQLYLGPSGDGIRGVRMNYDGTGAETVQFGFLTDPAGVKNTVSPTPTAFPSLGFAGCAPDTLQCGPDDEDGRGLFTSVILGGKEWLFAGGSRLSSILKHLYLTTDVGASPQFPFVAINPTGGTRGTTAAAALGSALYVALADGGGTGNPVLLKMTGFPADSSQPLYPAITNALVPSTLHSQGTGLIDALIVFGGNLYAANDGGCSRYNGSAWTNCTPAIATWTGKTSIWTTKSSDFVPADKAVPQMAEFNGRLYLARNTTSGPQLWACNPSGGVCSSGVGNWSIVPNQSGDPQLTQMGDSSLTTISLLVATSQHLYVGYDSAGGARLYSSTISAPANTGDFNAVSGAGLGVGVTQILDGRALSTSGREFLYVVARVGAGTAQVYRLAP